MFEFMQIVFVLLTATLYFFTSVMTDKIAKEEPSAFKSILIVQTVSLFYIALGSGYIALNLAYALTPPLTGFNIVLQMLSLIFILLSMKTTVVEYRKRSQE